MCRDNAGGLSEWAAWLAVGNDPKNRNYRRFFKRPEVIARVAELRAEFNNAAGIHLRYLQEKLLAIATTDVTDFFELRPYSSALRLKDPKTLPVHMRAAVSEMYVDKNGKVGLKLESKTHALDSLLKTIGAFAPSEPTVQVNLIEGLEVEHQRLVADGLRSLKRDPAGAGEVMALLDDVAEDAAS
jgi:hypothetical protein